MKIIWCILFRIALMNILVKENFPNIEVNDNERQIFFMSDYFFGDSLSFEVENAPSFMKFEVNKKVCSFNFQNPGQAAFLLDPPDEDTYQRLFILHHNATLGLYEMRNACNPRISSIDLQKILKKNDYLFINSSSLYSHYYLGRAVIKIKATLKSKDLISNYLLFLELVESDNDKKIQFNGVEPISFLEKATVLLHMDMFVAYVQCKDRNDCADYTGRNYGVSIYLIRGQSLQEYTPFLVAKLEADFFNQTMIKISSIQSSKDGILITDIENNLVYRVRVSSSNRLPEVVSIYDFPTRVETISVMSYIEDYFFVSSRLGSKKKGELYSVIKEMILHLFFDNSTEEIDESKERNKYKFYLFIKRILREKYYNRSNSFLLQFYIFIFQYMIFKKI